MTLPTIHITLPETTVTLDIRREDLIHPVISGNKFRKLKYSLLDAKAQGKDSLLTFGGAYSNHIAATAGAGKEHGFKTIGVIRGEELAIDLQKTLSQNPTLAFAVSCGMQLVFVSRSDYRRKNEADFLEALLQAHNHPYIIPEGGTNALAVKGCEEILRDTDSDYDYICCAAGTGGTVSGLINSAGEHQQVLGFPALKGDFLKEEIKKYTESIHWKLITDYHFGGYAKTNPELIRFINGFKTSYDVPLDPVYTGKMLYGIFDLLEKNYFPQNSRILAIHTGGLQGIAGMNKRLLSKGLSTIDI